MPREFGIYLSVAEAISHLGESSERELVDAHVGNKIQLVGRRRQGGRLSDTHEPLPREAFVGFEPEAAGAVRINRGTNSVEADASTEDFAQFERLAQYAWEDVKVAASEIDALAKSLNGRKRASANAETHCRKWLISLMEINPTSPKPKLNLQSEAFQKFKDLGKASFSRAWKAAAKEANTPAWSSAGRRPFQK